MAREVSHSSGLYWHEKDLLERDRPTELEGEPVYRPVCPCRIQAKPQVSPATSGFQWIQGKSTKHYLVYLLVWVALTILWLHPTFVLQLSELTPNKTRRAQCANWLLYYREELFGYTLEELLERKRLRLQAEAESSPEWKPPVTEVFWLRRILTSVKGGGQEAINTAERNTLAIHVALALISLLLFCKVSLLVPRYLPSSRSYAPPWTWYENARDRDPNCDVNSCLECDGDVRISSEATRFSFETLWLEVANLLVGRLCPFV
jgi:hypothetical protein